LSAFASTEIPFDEAPRAYEALDQRAPGVVHVALRYP
jgi:threonine dehydrogenase-like Zn-dependent dehydrogenase